MNQVVFKKYGWKNNRGYARMGTHPKQFRKKGRYPSKNSVVNPQNLDSWLRSCKMKEEGPEDGKNKEKLFTSF